eukprot:TRINITY_DN2644_c0_g3_i1.p1 TRINITY_DN2644_c0_g3~~TRINITY_DN2644_c0_g3_i1.p1  ORF type:complete len:236 (+),score=21.85 TRINITY_DN2644_c0_g3_i1:150-857(+)
MGCTTSKPDTKAKYKQEPATPRQESHIPTQKPMQQETVADFQNRGIVFTEPEGLNTDRIEVELAVPKELVANKISDDYEQSTELLKEKSSAPVDESPKSPDNNKEALLVKLSNSATERSNPVSASQEFAEQPKEPQLHFPFSTTNTELVAAINSILSTYKPISETEIPDPRVQSFRAFAQTLIEDFTNLVDDTRWKLHDKEVDWTAYNMLADSYVYSKSVGKTSATPIEVCLCLH